MRRDLYEPDHEAFREVVQAYVKREVTPNQQRWEQEHIVDRQAWLAAGKQARLPVVKRAFAALHKYTGRPRVCSAVSRDCQWREELVHEQRGRAVRDKLFGHGSRAHEVQEGCHARASAGDQCRGSPRQPHGTVS